MVVRTPARYVVPVIRGESTGRVARNAHDAAADLE